MCPSLPDGRYRDERGDGGIKIKVFPPHGCDRSALDERGWMEIEDGSSVRDVMKTIKCSPLKAKLLLVSVNGERTDLSRTLNEGDVVGFFYLISGG